MNGYWAQDLDSPSDPDRYGLYEPQILFSLYPSLRLNRKRFAGLKPIDFQKAAAILFSESTSRPISSTFIDLHSSTMRLASSLPTPFRRWSGLTKKSFTVITRPSSAEGVYTARATPSIMSFSRATKRSPGDSPSRF